MIELKRAILNHCNTLINNRIDTIQAVLNRVAESRDNESKSSVGDKYETGRAMMQLEEEKNKLQLSEALKARQVLERIDSNHKNDKVSIGSLVGTSQGMYFIAIGIGKIKVSGEVVYAISLDAPMGQALKNKVVGDVVTLGDRQIKIDAIY